MRHDQPLPPPKPREARTALQRGGLPDSFTKALYKVSPFRGCTHGCLYCDGRAEKYYVEGDFDRDILYSSNLISLLQSEVPTAREKGIVSFGSGTTDPYQPCEAALELTRNAAALVAENPLLSATVLTKSTLALRDLDIWKKINQTSGFTLMTTITTMHREIAAIFEPGAPPPDERMEMVRLFKEAGCRVLILAMPLLPGISDSDDFLAKLFESARLAGADAIMPGGLTLRPGRQKELYLNTIAGHYPQLLNLYEEMYRENRPSGAPLHSFSRELLTRCGRHLDALGVPWLMPHSKWAPMVSLCDSIHILLSDMVLLYQAHKPGIDIKPLSYSLMNFDEWLSTTRTAFRRRHDLPIGWIDETFRMLVTTNNLDAIIDNPRLSAFISEIVLNNKHFEYSHLRLC
ncbi:MAG: radical SAM protein [Rectinemataceae bacterium]|nr:radical SAM protein [Rectinemataceae bacterium]